MAWLCAFSQGHLTACSSLLIEPVNETLSKYSKYPSTCSSFKNCLWQEGCEACEATQHPFPVVQGQVYRGKQNYQNLSAAALPLSRPMPRLTQGSSEDDSQICGVKVLSPREENSRSPVLSPDSMPQLNRCPRGTARGKGLGHVCGNGRLCHQR